MVGHLFNHFVFAARLSERTKWSVFATVVSLVVGVFWWFRGIAWGIEGPVGDYWGLKWRKVRLAFVSFPFLLPYGLIWDCANDLDFPRPGIFTRCAQKRRSGRRGMVWTFNTQADLLVFVSLGRVLFYTSTQKCLSYAFRSRVYHTCAQQKRMDSTMKHYLLQRPKTLA